MSTPKVSVVIPCYNASKYLRECLDSVVNQTLQDIQIICVDDGSTDNTALILDEYAKKDSRLQIISKANTGYGDSMNRGFAAAEGEYLGIVESDDFAEPDMFEQLYTVAVKHNLDVCKAGFFQFSSGPVNKNVPVLTAVKFAKKNVFCPMTDFKSHRKQAEFFTATAAIWAGIYRRDFIRANDIQFNPTPGASYQDIGFCFKVWAKAQRVLLLNRCFLHYRTDNEYSSVHSAEKVYCICNEFEEIERYLSTDHLQFNQTLPLMICAKYNSYIWNYERLSGASQKEFLLRFYEEFYQYQQNGILNKAFFPWYFWNNLQMLLIDFERYHNIQSRKLAGESAEDFYDAYPEHRPIKGKLLYYFTQNLLGAMSFVNQIGILPTMQLLVHKTAQHIGSFFRKDQQ